MRSLQHYFEIKVIIAETEIFSIHQQDLVARPGDFGADFRARVLPAVLFTANDYVQATREHRRMVAEMAPLYRQYDAFITAGQGEAPRLDAHRSLTFWQRPNLLQLPTSPASQRWDSVMASATMAYRWGCRCSAALCRRNSAARWLCVRTGDPLASPHPHSGCRVRPPR